MGGPIRKGMKSTAVSKQRNSITAKRKGNSVDNPAKSSNLVKYSDILGLSPKEWQDRMIRTRAIKTALQMNLLQAAVDAGLEKLMTEAIRERSVEKADLLERICKIVGAVFREQQPGQPGVQVHLEGSVDTNKPLSVKFVDAQEVENSGEQGDNE